MLLHCAIAGTTHKHTSSPSFCQHLLFKLCRHQCGTTYIFEEKAVAASLEWHGVTQNTLFLLHDWSNTLYCYNLFCNCVCLLVSYFIFLKDK